MKNKFSLALIALILSLSTVLCIASCQLNQNDVDNDAQNKADELNEELTKLKNDTAEKDKKISELENEKNTLNTSKTELESDIATLKAEKDALSAKIAELEAEKAALIAELEEQKIALEVQHQNDIAKLNVAFSRQKAEFDILIAKLTAEKQTLEATIKLLEFKLNCLKGKHTIIMIDNQDGTETAICQNCDEEHYTYEEATDTYIVYTAYGLTAWNEIALTNLSANLIIANDITLSGNNNWQPLGYLEETPNSNSPIPFVEHEFTGTIDGAGHTITGLSIDSDDNAAFVRYLDENATIKNLSFENATIRSQKSASVIVFSNLGKIENCHVLSGTVKGAIEYNAGGICVSSTGIISNCSNAASVTGSTSGGLGGILSKNSPGGIVIGCINSGNITSTYDRYGNNCVGGVVGVQSGILVACINTGSVNASAHYEPALIGGTAGLFNMGEIYSCYTTVTYESSHEGETLDKDGIGREMSTDTFHLGCYSIRSSSVVSQDIVDDLNEAIDEYNKTATVKCDYVWTFESNKYPILQQVS